MTSEAPEDTFVDRYLPTAGRLQNLLAEQDIGPRVHEEILRAGCDGIARTVARNVEKTWAERMQAEPGQGRGLA